MAGFLSPLFLLGLGAPAAVSQAGYTSVLPVPQLGGSAVTQAGYTSVLPVPQLGGGAVLQAGYIGVIPIINLAGTGPTGNIFFRPIFTPVLQEVYDEVLDNDKCC